MIRLLILLPYLNLLLPSVQLTRSSAIHQMPVNWKRRRRILFLIHFSPRQNWIFLRAFITHAASSYPSKLIKSSRESILIRAIFLVIPSLSPLSPSLLTLWRQSWKPHRRYCESFVLDNTSKPTFLTFFWADFNIIRDNLLLVIIQRAFMNSIKNEAFFKAFITSSICPSAIRTTFSNDLKSEHADNQKVLIFLLYLD